MEKETLWRKVDGNLNINEILKYQHILPCYFCDMPDADVDGTDIFYVDGCFGFWRVAYKCKPNGSIIAVKYYHH